MILFDKLSYSSPVRQTSPALKSLFAVGSLVICVSFRQVSVCVLVLCCMAACTLQFANVTPRRYLRFLLGPLVFLALSSVAVLFFVSSSPQELFSFRLFSRYIGISRLSFSNWYSLMAVAFSGVSCLYFLILTTPVTDLMLLIYRAIFVLLDIASAIQTAQNCRLGNRTFRSKLSCMGQMLSVLLVRSLKKSSLLYDAMESRLYDGKIQVLEETQPARPLAWAACCGWLVLCTVLCILLP